jgi:hypothetical protein
MAIPLPLAQVLSSQTPVQNYQLTLSLAYNILAWTRQKTQLFYCYVCVCCCGTVFTELLPELALVYPPISQSLYSNSSTCYNINAMHAFFNLFQYTDSVVKNTFNVTQPEAGVFHTQHLEH